MSTLDDFFSLPGKVCIRCGTERNLHLAFYDEQSGDAWICEECEAKAQKERDAKVAIRVVRDFDEES